MGRKQRRPQRKPRPTVIDQWIPPTGLAAVFRRDRARLLADPLLGIIARPYVRGEEGLTITDTQLIREMRAAPQRYATLIYRDGPCTIFASGYCKDPTSGMSTRDAFDTILASLRREVNPLLRGAWDVEDEAS
ncbi:MAG TPA: hypothetical protein VF916_01865 [Ktedonobacterales bacterium]